MRHSYLLALVLALTGAALTAGCGGGGKNGVPGSIPAPSSTADPRGSDVVLGYQPILCYYDGTSGFGNKLRTENGEYVARVRDIIAPDLDDSATSQPRSRGGVSNTEFLWIVKENGTPVEFVKVSDAFDLAWRLHRIGHFTLEGYLHVNGSGKMVGQPIKLRVDPNPDPLEGVMQVNIVQNGAMLDEHTTPVIEPGMVFQLKIGAITSPSRGDNSGVEYTWLKGGDPFTPEIVRFDDQMFYRYRIGTSGQDFGGVPFQVTGKWEQGGVKYVARRIFFVRPKPNTSNNATVSVAAVPPQGYDMTLVGRAEFGVWFKDTQGVEKEMNTVLSGIENSKFVADIAVPANLEVMFVCRVFDRRNNLLLWGKSEHHTWVPGVNSQHFTVEVVDNGPFQQ